MYVWKIRKTWLKMSKLKGEKGKVVRNSCSVSGYTCSILLTLSAMESYWKKRTFLGDASSSVVSFSFSLRARSRSFRVLSMQTFSYFLITDFDIESSIKPGKIDLTSERQKVLRFCKSFQEISLCLDKSWFNNGGGGGGGGYWKAREHESENMHWLCAF